MLDYSALQFFADFLIFVIGIIVSVVAAKYFSTSKVRAMTIFGWHTFFCILYLGYILSVGGDALNYYNAALDYSSDIMLGTNAVIFLTALIVHGFGASLLGAFLFFNIFGTVGLLAFDASLRIATQNMTRYVRIISSIFVFLPSLSFWSSAIGKDALSFFAAGLALWAALALGRRWLLMVFAVAVMLLVRPHMAGIMVIAWFFSLLISRDTPTSLKVLLGVMFAIVVPIILPIASEFAGLIELTDPEAVMGYVETRQSYNMGGTSSVDITSMSLPMQLFTYLFRPMLFEAGSVFAFSAALDNLMLLYLFVMGGVAVLRGRKSSLGESRSIMWAYSLLSWLALALTTANLGIALRQKWMFTPMLIFLMLTLMGGKRGMKANCHASKTRRHSDNAAPITTRAP